VVMFLAPAVLVALAVTGVLAAIAVAVLWAFVLGDSTWPGFIVPAVVGVAVLCFLGVSAIFLSLAYTTGMAAEAHPMLNRGHLAFSGVANVLAVLALLGAGLYLSHYFSDAGPEVQCSRLCQKRGFSISKPSPPQSGARSCICMDSNAREAATIPLPDAPKR